jgi:hypothetical protein
MNLGKTEHHIRLVIILRSQAKLGWRKGRFTATVLAALTRRGKASDYVKILEVRASKAALSP